MDINTLRKIDELIALTDGPCGCDDSSCHLCRIVDLLWNVRKEVEAHLGAEQEDILVVNPPLH